MNVGIAPNKDGLLDDEDVKALADFGRLKASFFSKPITNGLCNVVVMSEDVIARGEACDEWWLFDGKEKLAHGKTIGIKRIRTLERPRRAENLQLEVDGDPVNGVDAKALPMKFYYVEPFEEIQEPDIDKATKTITSYVRDHEGMYIEKWKWKNGKLTMVSSKKELAH